METVYVKTYQPPEVDIEQITRYACIGELTDELEKLTRECLSEVLDKLSYKVCYCKVPVIVDEEVVDFGFAKVKSRNLSKNLANCTSAILFAASIGIEIDRLIKKYSLLAPSKAVMFQSIGAERVESLCNTFNDEIDLELKNTKPRYSPGYGDFPLEFQREIFKVLNCPKNIGVSLSDNCLMTPSKSVTAIIGINNGDKNEDN